MNCSKNLRDTDKWCPDCGKPVKTDSEEEMPVLRNVIRERNFRQGVHINDESPVSRPSPSLTKTLLLVVIVALISSGLAYFLKPNKATVFSYKINVGENSQLSCSAIMGATLFPNPNWEEREAESIEGTLFTKDETKVAIDIGEDTIKFLSATSVEVGISQPAEFLIIRNDEKSLVAVYPENDVAIDPGINTFVLNKESGLATWTKSKPAFLTTPLPDTQVYYMECR